MNNLGDILHFMSKCVHIMKSYQKMYSNKRNFIAMFKKLSATRICNKNRDFYFKKFIQPWQCHSIL